jgi:hypothetical protein
MPLIPVPKDFEMFVANRGPAISPCLENDAHEDARREWKRFTTTIYG